MNFETDEINEANFVRWKRPVGTLLLTDLINKGSISGLYDYSVTPPDPDPENPVAFSSGFSKGFR